MEQAGATLVRHYREMAFMGFWEVVQNLGAIRRNFRDCERDLLAHRPDVLILIDYAGFNLRMARFAKKHGIRVFYYISPKVWAWNQRRALNIKATVDRLFVILTFEVDFFRKYDYRAEYVGNPLMDAIAAFRPDPAFARSFARPVVALLPGSRRQEVEAMLPAMLAATKHLAGYQFVVAGVSNLPDALYQRHLADYPDVGRVNDAAYDLLAVAQAALVTSGTATLETALLNVPQVVCYRTGRISYEIARRLIAVPYISLVNLIADKPAVTELIQHDLTSDRLADELRQILPGGPRREQVLTDYAELRERVGGPGASDRAGERMVRYLRSAE